MKVTLLTEKHRYDLTRANLKIDGNDSLDRVNGRIYPSGTDYTDDFDKLCRVINTELSKGIYADFVIEGVYFPLRITRFREKPGYYFIRAKP